VLLRKMEKLEVWNVPNQQNISLESDLSWFVVHQFGQPELCYESLAISMVSHNWAKWF
jgi:hypothetical protein